MLTWIAFDADDTLWENEHYYKQAQEKFIEILSAYSPPELIDRVLLETETRNIPFYGYGIKSFGLSMIETAINLSDGMIQGGEIQKILDVIRNMVNTRVEVLPGVHETLKQLTGNFNLMLITKGDLLDQERKLEQSGLKEFFCVVEVVNTKDLSVYKQILKKKAILPEEFLMIGNSLRSDVLPVSALGAHGVLINHHFTWEHERLINADIGQHDYYEIEKITELPSLIESINKKEENIFD